MIVQILKKAYKMGANEADKLLEMAKEQVPFGVYAVKKGDQIIMLNEKARSKTHLKQLIRDYKSQGFKVYHNVL